MSELIRRGRAFVNNRVGDVTLNLPFVSFAVSPKDKERQIARELVILLRDRRVLSARECCDNCIDNALASLQEIRRTLVDKQVELAEMQDGPLNLAIEAMALGIRQFLTFEQRLRQMDEIPDAPRDFRRQPEARQPEARQMYFDALEILRGHLIRCLGQVAALAGMDAPSDDLIANYQGAWQLEAYKPLELPGGADRPEG